MITNTNGTLVNSVQIANATLAKADQLFGYINLKGGVL
jgi:hypothetical protein